ncbi:unnamed protein product [Amoebophrya sp. A120]|nr:unnamed protein product [Amoebophrya sp. A120]|eukprot:GSA120T00015458001.1
MLPLDRIVSTLDLRALLWEVHLLPQSQYLRSQVSGGRVEVVDCPTRKLPTAPVVFQPREIGDVMLCNEVESASPVTALPTLTKLQAHRRLCHLFNHEAPFPTSCDCPECALTKGRKKGSKNERTTTLAAQGSTAPLRQINTDFYGPMPLESIRRCKLFQVFICDAVAHVWVFPVRHRNECVELAQKLVTQVRATDGEFIGEKVIRIIRSDNDTVYRSEENSSQLQQLEVDKDHSIPYCPQLNAVAERFMQSLGTNLRAVLCGADHRLHCYAGEYIAAVWNRIARKEYKRAPEYNGMSPLQARLRRTDPKRNSEPVALREEREQWQSQLRRFGCLAYVMLQPREKVQKGQPKYRKAVFLGLSKNNSAWLFGVVQKDSRTAAGTNWQEIESRDAKFVEEVVISDIDKLLPETEGVYVTDEKLLSLACGSTCGPGSVVQVAQPGASDLPAGRDSSGIDTLAPVAPSRNNSKRSKDSDFVVEIPPAEQKHDAAEEEDSSDDEKEEKSVAIPHGRKDASPEVVYGPPVRRGRGRPPGSKDKKPRKKRQKKKQKNRNNHSSCDAHFARADFEAQFRENFCAFADLNSLEEDEQFIEAFLMITMAEALRAPDAPSWLQAMDREKLKQEAYKVWRELTDEEMKKEKQILPIAMVLTRKRDGSYKARAVVLGNLVKDDGTTEIYAPVVSFAGNRYLMTEAAAEGDYVLPYDIDVAFLHAELDEEVYVRLPPQWVKNNENSVKRLVKALYGLKQSPRAWFKRYEKELLALGWEQAKDEPGLWKKPSVKVPSKFLKLSVYVDDNVGTGPHKQELDQELAQVMQKFPGKYIPYDDLGEGWKRWDILGGDFIYRRETRELKINMSRYIVKMAERFGLKEAKPASSPSFSEAALLENEDKVVKFPFREAVGALQWCVSVCRADVCQPVNTLARCVSRPTTRAKVNAIKKIIRYLVATKDDGVTYSPAQEQEFRKIYQDLLPAGDRLPHSNTFGDASFASDSVTMRSVSGTVVYYRSVPIMWKSSRQTVRAYSTSEAEHIAASDSLVVTEGASFLEFFNPHPLSDEIDFRLWCDNTSAISVANAKETRPKSRHYALRWWRVKDAAKRLCFCPTHLQRADALTKQATRAQRNMLIHTTEISPEFDDDYDDDDTETGTALLVWVMP